MNINHIMMEKFFGYTGWFFILQPYISPFPTNTDLQPVGLLFCILSLFSKFLMRLVWPRNYFLFIYTSIFIELFHLIAFQSVAGVYLASVIFILFSVEFKNLLTRKLLLLTLSFHIFCMLVQFIDSELFGLLFSDFVRELKDTGIQGRGLTGPTPEPSFSSALLTVYALIYACVFLKKSPLYMSLIFFIVYLLGILLSAATLGYLFFPFVVFAWLFNLSLKLSSYVFLIVTIAVALFLSSYFVSLDQRGIRLIAVLIEDPAKFLIDGSVQERFRSLFVGIISVNKFPLGVGHNNFPIATIYVNTVHPLSEIFPKTREIVGSASGLAKVLVGTGYLGLTFYLFLFLKTIGKPKIKEVFSISVAMAMFTFSFSPAFPLIYVLLTKRE